MTSLPLVLGRGCSTNTTLWRSRELMRPKGGVFCKARLSLNPCARTCVPSIHHLVLVLATYLGVSSAVIPSDSPWDVEEEILCIRNIIFICWDSTGLPAIETVNKRWRLSIKSYAQNGGRRAVRTPSVGCCESDKFKPNVYPQPVVDHPIPDQTSRGRSNPWNH